MSGLDGALIDEATAGINAPADGDQNTIVRVNDADAPELPNLRYQPVAAFAAELAVPIINQAAAQAESPDGSIVDTSSTHEVDLELTEGTVYECTMNAVTEDGDDGVEFYETRRVVVFYPSGGTPTILSSAVIYSNSYPDWTFAASIAGTNLRATLTNDSLLMRGCDVSIGIVRARQIPAAP